MGLRPIIGQKNDLLECLAVWAVVVIIWMRCVLPSLEAGTASRRVVLASTCVFGMGSPTVCACGVLFAEFCYMAEVKAVEAALRPHKVEYSAALPTKIKIGASSNGITDFWGNRQYPVDGSGLLSLDRMKV